MWYAYSIGCFAFVEGVPFTENIAFAEGVPFADRAALAIKALVFARVDVAVLLSFLPVVLAGVTATTEVLGGLAFDFVGVDLTAASETGALLDS